MSPYGDTRPCLPKRDKKSKKIENLHRQVLDKEKTAPKNLVLGTWYLPGATG
jgi:hypothetical protein